MRYKSSTLGLVAGLTLSATALGVGASTVGAESASCTGTTGFVLAAQHVTVLDKPSTYPASCVRFSSPYVRWNGSAWVTNFGTQLRDTARDNQVAVVLARVAYPNGTVSVWHLAQPPSGTEAFLNMEYRTFTTYQRPSSIEFAACRSTSWSSIPTNACRFMSFPLPQG